MQKTGTMTGDKRCKVVGFVHFNRGKRKNNPAIKRNDSDISD